MSLPSEAQGDGRHVPLSLFDERGQIAVTRSSGEVVPVNLEDMGFTVEDDGDGGLVVTSGSGLPDIEPGDAGKVVAVNDDEDGYELVESGGSSIDNLVYDSFHFESLDRYDTSATNGTDAAVTNNFTGVSLNAGTDDTGLARVVFKDKALRTFSQCVPMSMTCDVEFTVPSSDEGAVYILTGGIETGSGARSMGFVIQFSGGTATLSPFYKNNTSPTILPSLGAWSNNSILRVDYDGTDVTYYVNGVLVATASSLSFLSGSNVPSRFVATVAKSVGTSDSPTLNIGSVHVSYVKK